MTEAISAWPNADYYVPKLQRVRNNLMEKGCKAYDPDPKQFNTLIHGDLFVEFYSLRLSIEICCKILKIVFFSRLGGPTMS